jgi:CheY-like chemotaxis protein
MTTPQSIALAGFPPEEHLALSTLLKLAGNMGMAFTIVADPAAAQQIVANADDATTMEMLRRMPPGPAIVLIGRSDAGTGWPLLARPIKLLAVLNALDGRPGARPGPRPPDREPAPPAGGFAATQPFAPLEPGSAGGAGRGGFAATQPFAPLEHGAADGSGLGSFAATQPFAPLDGLPPAAAPAVAHQAMPRDINASSIEQWRGARQAQQLAELPPSVRGPGFDRNSSNFLGINDPGAALPPPTQVLGEALVVDDNDVSRRALQKRLHAAGLRTDWVRQGHEAVQQAALRPYRLVLIDDQTLGMDIFQLLRALRRGKPSAGQRAPLLVLLSSRGGTLEKLRARLAGCDVYLVKPVQPADLDQALSRGLR